MESGTRFKVQVVRYGKVIHEVLATRVVTDFGYVVTYDEPVTVTNEDELRYIELHQS